MGPLIETADIDAKRPDGALCFWMVAPAHRLQWNGAAPLAYAKKGKAILMARQQHSKDGEWGNGVVFSVALLGLVVLAGLYYVFSNNLDEGAWNRFATSAVNIPPAISSAHANPI